MTEQRFFTDTPQKLAKDWELQEWGKMLTDESEGLGLKASLINQLLK